ncbi:CBS domain-containing protein [Streptococcus pacificus]|uniref:CBS domain-containing protein n=1 Tax=Streptococcus pacificus TaxID=2740577 RepID=A0ABS0ZJ40_9STRE|nr:CBS domain-containing protein [Streptococcus pacificus]MBJ8326030.1 CBS domain-containing protein [Streptococcus pacificus]
MAVRDFMTDTVIHVSPDTTVAQAADMMKEKNFRRLPVVENGKLVGLVTEGTLADAKPSKATTLSIYEMNYLLNKTRIKDVMVKSLITIEPNASLEDAIYLMMTNKIGVLPVLDKEQLVGIITDKDVFKTFLEVSGYGVEGIRIRIEADNKVGVLAKIVQTISEENLNISRTVEANKDSGKVIIEVQIDGSFDTEAVRKTLNEKLQPFDITVESIVETSAKELL